MSYWFKNKYSPHLTLNIKVTQSLFKVKSSYQKIEVLQSVEFGRLLVLDGIVNVSEYDEYIYHEMLVHVPLCTHPRPENILVIGGGDGGTVRELGKHSLVRKIDLVEIDPLVVTASKQFLPFTGKGLKDSRVTIHYEDGAQFVKRQENLYDVIIIDSPDPIGAGKKLFQKEFYTDCMRALKKDGILTAHAESPTFHKEYKILKWMHTNLRALFPRVSLYTAHIPSYDISMWCFVFCSKKYDPLKNYKDAKYVKLGLKTRYYNSEIHRASFAHPNYLREKLEL